MTGNAALIGLFGAILGVLLSNLFVALLDNRRRNQKQLDLAIAIHAEISAGLGANAQQLTPEERAYALADQDPFQTPDDTDVVFDAIKGDISLLPSSVIHDVVRYYRFARQSNLMTEDVRHPLFAAQNKDEKRKFMQSLLDVAEQQRVAGLEAIDLLEVYAFSRGETISRPPHVEAG